MRIGLALPQYDGGLESHVQWKDTERAALAAEAVGLHSVWVSDHLFLDWSKSGGPNQPQGALEALTTLSAVATRTKSIRIGSLTLSNEFRNPLLLAKMVTTIDHVSGGRLEIGLGAGWYADEFAAAGIPFPEARERVDRLAETVTILVSLFAGEKTSSERYGLRGALLAPRPLQRPRPPVWIGGKGERVMRAAASVADGLNLWRFDSVEEYRRLRARADAACAAVGRDPETLRRSLATLAVVGRDDAELRRRTESLVGRLPQGVAAAKGLVGAKASFDGRLIGTVGHIADTIGKLGEMGVEEVVLSFGFMPFEPVDEDAVELVGEVAAQLA